MTTATPETTETPRDRPATPPGGGDLRWILSILPHRFPMLLVDRVLEIEPKRRLVAVKNVTYNESYLQGHFPEHPIVPGVLIIEGMAQAGGLLLLHDLPDREGKLVYFTSIDEARFRRPVVPGDVMRYEIEVLRLRPSYAKLRGRVTVDGILTTEAVLACATVDR